MGSEVAKYGFGRWRAKSKDRRLCSAIWSEPYGKQAPKIRIPLPLNDEVPAFSDNGKEGSERALDDDVKVKEQHRLCRREKIRRKYSDFWPASLPPSALWKSKFRYGPHRDPRRKTKPVVSQADKFEWLLHVP
jgi:hypothetical protein